MKMGDVMKKKNVIVILTVIIFAVAAATILGIIFIDRPAFASIEEEEIATVSYFINYYENEEPVYITLPEENVDELLSLMHDIKIKGFGTSDIDDMIGTTYYMFEIELNNGERIEFSAMNPHMQINGKYYDTEYEQADALYEFWRGFVAAGRKEYGLDG